MIETVDDTLNIATKTTVHVGFIGFLTRVFGAVIRLIAVHEAVAHDEVHDIRRIETLAVTAALAALVDDVVIGRFLMAFLERNTVGTRLEHVEVHEQVVRALGVVLVARHEA